MGKRLVKPEAGDVFAIPLPDGDQAIGQVTARIDELGSIGCALFPIKHRLHDPVPILDDPISVQLVTSDLVQRRYWPILETRPVKVSPIHFKWEDHRHSHWVGVVIRGSGIISEFMLAYHGFRPWDSMADPEYFGKLLIRGASRPSTAYAAGG